jgi:XTP/dITP diphosphohydrolase
MKKLYFVTQNKHKVAEVGEVLKEFDVEIEQIPMDYFEDTDDTTQEIALKAAKELANKLNKTLIVEDTGIFFKVYNNFPGVITKRIFQAIGYEGLLKLLEGKNREAYFLVVIGYCEPGKEPVLFEGRLEGSMLEEIQGMDKDVLAYERFFKPVGYDEPMCFMSREEKNKISHRAIAARKLGEFLTR